MSKNGITASFAEAATRLGFEFQPAVRIRLSDGVFLQSEGLLPHFGAPRGMAVFSDEFEPAWSQLRQLQGLGYGFSVLASQGTSFDEESFIEMLNDWGFNGPQDACPNWYSGQPWGAPPNGS